MSEEGMMMTTITRVVLAVTLAAAFVCGLTPTADAQSASVTSIMVRGDWTITVRNADGTVAQHHAFKNALHGGDSVLAGLLTRTHTFDKWKVRFTTDTAGAITPCGGCMLTEGAPSATDQQLGITLTSEQTADKGVLLKGQIRAYRNGEIRTVETYINVCLPDGGCGPANFSRKDLPAPISVVNDQIVQVTVKFSFTSGT